MTNKTIKMLSLAGLSLMTFAAADPLVNAADVTYPSKGTIKYTASDDVTVPVDPQDPTKPVTPIDPVDDETPITPGTAGPLSIDFASSFNFGEQEITSVDKVYYAAPQKVKLADNSVVERTNYVQVTDNRGTFAGWSLSVKATEFTTIDNSAITNGAGTLNGAKITLADAEIESASANPADVSAASTTLAPNVASATILGATAGKGAGTNLLDFGKADGSTKATAVSLAVPGATAKAAATYTADLTWTLSDTPANS